MHRLPLVAVFLAMCTPAAAAHAGDTSTGAGVSGEASEAGPAAEPRGPSQARVHEVKEGETLWTIAAAAIGDGTLWPALYRANRDQIKDPSLVYPGQRLTIPAIEPASRAAVRRQAAVLTR